MKIRRETWLDGASALVVALLTAVAAIRPIDDPDYFWHLATGRYLVAHRVVPAVDPFSHTFAGHPWTHIDWIGDVIMFALVRLGGDTANIVAFALVGGATLGWLTHRGTAGSGRRVAWIGLVVGMLASTAMLFRLTPRPQTLTFAFLVAELACLEGARSRPRLALVVPVLIVFWQNEHASALAGAGVVVLHAVGLVLDRAIAKREPARLVMRNTWIAAIASVGALWIAPHPVARLRAVFEHVSNPANAQLIPEWRPLWAFHVHPASVALVVLMVLALIGAWPHAERDVTWGERLVAVSLSMLAIKSIRFVPLAVVGLVPLAAAGLGRLDARMVSRSSLRVMFAAVACIAAGAFWSVDRTQPALGRAPDAFPAGATAFLARAHPHGRLYNDFYYGGYLLWELDARVPVFIDGRSGTVYGSDFLARVAGAGTTGLARFIDEFDLGVAVAALDTRAAWFQSRPDWTLVYADDVSFVAVRTRDNPTLARDGFREIHPSAPLRDLDRWSNDPFARELASREVLHLRRLAPNDALPHVIAASLALASGDLATSDAEIDAALRRRPAFVPALQARVLQCVRRRDRDCACRESNRLRLSAPDDGLARDVARALRCP